LFRFKINIFNNVYPISPIILKGGLSIYKSLYKYLLYLDLNLPSNYYYLLITKRIIFLSILFLSKNLEFL